MSRPKGTKNKHTFQAEEVANRMGIDPLEVLLMFASNDWKALGYEAETRTSFAASGIEFEEPVIRPQDRLTAAKEAAKYLYSAKQAVALSTGSEGIKITVCDYTSKETK